MAISITILVIIDTFCSSTKKIFVEYKNDYVNVLHIYLPNTGHSIHLFEDLKITSHHLVSKYKNKFYVQ